MRKLFVLSLFAVSFASCGGDPCADTDYSVGGFCVVENGYDIDPAQIEVAVAAVEYAFSATVEIDPSLGYYLEEGQWRLEFVGPDHEMLLPDEYSDRGYWGRCDLWENTIYVRGDAAFAITGEVRVYHVLAHELMHWVIDQWLNVSLEENGAHSTDGVWNLPYELNGVEAPSDTAENLAYDYINRNL